MSTNLPAPLNPFPVFVPYTVRSDLYQLGKPAYGQVEDTVFRIDSEYPIDTAERLRILQEHPEHSRLYLTDDLENLIECLWDLAAYIAIDQPQYAVFADGRFQSKLLGISLGQDYRLSFAPNQAKFPDLGERCYVHLESLTTFERLSDLLTLSVQEDLFIGKVLDEAPKDGQAGDIMEWMLVAFPSHWSPQSKIGLSFAGVHAPIPNNERLIGAANKLVKAMSTRGPFMRYNWTFSTHHLSRNPALTERYAADASYLFDTPDRETFMDRLYFRTERQTFVPFPRYQRYLFTIHTYLNQIHQALNTPERWDTMMAAMETVPANVLEHRRNLGKIIATLSWWNEQHNRSEPT